MEPIKEDEFLSRFGRFFFFMKIGGHAGENLDDILRRKQNEITSSGVSFWGFGGRGNLIMKVMVNFLSYFNFVDQKHVYVMFEEVKHDCRKCGRFIEPSRFFKEPGDIEWQEIPRGVNVTGSRHALLVDKFEQTDFMIRSSDAVVFFNDSCCLDEIQVMNDVVKKRVDKCIASFDSGFALKNSRKTTNRGYHITHVGRLVSPYAVDVQ